MDKQETFLSLEQTQKMVLDVMKEFHQYCEKHQLRYCLLCGTLLGAVRHHGFIPWDDDIDIVMPREDYDRLKETVRKEAVSPWISFIDYQSFPDFHYVISRVCHNETVVKPPYLLHPVEEMGVWVDIFPLDGYSPWLYWIQRPLLWVNNMLCNINNYAIPHTGSRMKRLIQKVVLKCFPDKNNRYEKRIDRISEWVKYRDSDRVIMISDLDHPRDEVFLRSDIDQAAPGRFEDAEFYMPQNADRILRNIYGNYMELPPEEKRIPHESFARMRQNRGQGE